MKTAPPIDSFAQWPASWYRFCASRELARGPVSKTMLGRQLVAYRGASGALTVMDSRCSHMGADLGCGQVEGESIVCPYHGWSYGADGLCRRAPGMAQPPRFARQVTFPVVERHGHVFWFHGPEPLFPLPFFIGERAEDYDGGRIFSYEADCRWFVNSAHAFDRQHFDSVHDRRLVAPPEIDCPAPFARRNRYRAEVLGRTRLDCILRVTAGRMVNISLTVWGGTFCCVTGDFDRARSRFLMITRPLENGHTLCEGLVLAPRPANALTLWTRRFFTHGYLADEARKLRGTRYDAARFVEADSDMIDFFHWLNTLPQKSPRPSTPEPVAV
ncbi:MAG TPA: Rieske 2Fe-2S domain-containing protein [Chthoniobacteraceae bacterium]|nr:Rieske 2Fe-2S domain-containing protein [Chthoniobacteraceae bacterium]